MAHFKLESELPELRCSFKEGHTLEFVYKFPVSAQVRLKPKEKNDIGKSAAIGASCTALSVQEVENEVSEEIENNFEGNRIKTGNLSAASRDVLDHIYFNLRNLSRSTVAMFNWRNGLSSPPDPCPSEKSRPWYSRDGKEWFEYSLARRIDIIFGDLSIKSDRALTDEVVKLVETAAEVPIGRQIFYEAWSQKGANQRSALVIGVAAAEVGLVRLINTLMPGSIQAGRTPPFAKMLRKYLPKLPVRVRRSDGRSIMPPPGTITQIEAAIKCRNAVVHAGALPPKREDLTLMLRAISDFLWMCDVYLGELWAIRHISLEAQKHWV